MHRTAERHFSRADNGGGDAHAHGARASKPSRVTLGRQYLRMFKSKSMALGCKKVGELWGVCVFVAWRSDEKKEKDEKRREKNVNALLLLIPSVVVVVEKRENNFSHLLAHGEKDTNRVRWSLAAAAAATTTVTQLFVSPSSQSHTVRSNAPMLATCLRCTIKIAQNAWSCLTTAHIKSSPPSPHNANTNTGENYRTILCAWSTRVVFRLFIGHI